MKHDNNITKDHANVTKDDEIASTADDKVTTLTITFGGLAIASFTLRAFRLPLEDWHGWVELVILILSIVVFTALLIVRCNIYIQRKKIG